MNEDNEVLTKTVMAILQSIKDTAMTPAPGHIIDVTVRGNNFSFSPKNLTVKEGETVRVTFINNGGLHDFVIDAFTGARTKQIKGGEQEVIEFVADKKGAFAYYCSVGEHRAMGMEGTLTVE